MRPAKLPLKVKVVELATPSRSVEVQQERHGGFDEYVGVDFKSTNRPGQLDVPEPVTGEKAFEIALRAGIVTSTGRLKSRYR